MSAMHTAYWKDDSGSQMKYLAAALLLHVALGVLLVGFNWRSNSTVIPQLAINATLVDRNTLNQLARAQPAPSPPVKPVEDKQQELAKQREQEEHEKEIQKQESLKQEREKQEQLKQEQVLQQQALEKQQRLVADAEQKKQADQQRKAAAQVEQQKQQDAEKKRVADIQQKQRDVEAKRQADSDAKAQASKEAELKAQLAAEEGRDSAVNSGAQDKYAAMIKQRVMRAWIKPPSAKLGLECDVAVTQAVGGMVLSAQVQSCNGDAAVRQSIENAVLNASPLPPPDDPRVFMRNFVLKFKPSE